MIKRILLIVLLSGHLIYAQNSNPVIENIINEANNNSQLEELAYKLLDVVGPRLVGTPQMKNAHDWVASQYEEWGISSRLEQYGEWNGWERGITHIDMIYPRNQTLKGTQLAWSPGTSDAGITAELITIPRFRDEADFNAWLPSVKGKIVMVSFNHPTGRPDYNWEEWATEESFQNMKANRDSLIAEWRSNLARSGHNYYGVRFSKEGFRKLEEAGALGVIANRWSRGFGANKIFSSYTTIVPTIDLSLEDYTMLYRMVEHGVKPQIKVVSKSKDLGKVPTYNSFGEIKGTEKPNEYVMLSAHLDTWDGSSGATDNGTGTITMMEAMRILKKFYPNPKRTILAGHWEGEEQGLNGSRAFVEDHPEIVNNLQALFNQDSGTGRVESISGSGFLYAYDFLNRWLHPVPKEITDFIKTEFPGSPSGGGSDHSSFIAVGAPGFNLNSLNWSYDNYTWHTNIDTYDKIIFDDVRNNAILTAILVYMASEDPRTFPRDKRVMPLDKDTGKPLSWPAQRSPNRKGN
ncbi:MAG: M28 family peptidase [Bacteroidia bacterium]|nr:M28 family peptidase [Bacteroidia bacterium]